MSYEDYENFFCNFNTKQGYADACRYLAFDQNRWNGFKSYEMSIRKAIVETKKRLGINALEMVDLCCGEYSWLPRHFSDSASRIYAIDLEDVALESARRLSPKVVAIQREGSEALKALQGIQFLYCGFNFYEHFIQGMYNALSEKGGFFLMKPKIGDDLTLRSWFTNYSLESRIEEMDRMQQKLDSFFSLQIKNITYSWSFEPELDKILAAMSVVCFGGEISKKRRLTLKEYERGIAFLEKKVINDKLILSQEVVIWTGEKK